MVQEMHLKGGPGSGKTTYGQNLVEEYIRDGVFRPREIIAMSFTRTAVAELVNRNILEKDNVGTLHSMGYGQLGISIPVIGGDRGRNKVDVTTIWNQANPGFRIEHSSRDNFWKDPDEELHKDSPLGTQILSRLDYYRNTMEDFEKWDRMRWAEFIRNNGLYTLPDSIPLMWQRLKEFKYEYNCCDFTDMVEVPYRKNLGPPSSEARMIWCDEAQDLTPLQLRRIRQMGEDVELLLFTYDDDQCLYEHLGADPTILFHEKPKDALEESLKYSHRMSHNIATESRRWIRRNTDRIDVDFQAMPERGMGTVMKVGFSYQSETEVATLAKGAAVSGESLMILTSCGYMADEVATTLKANGIPFHNPYRVTNGSWNPIRETTRENVSELIQGHYNAGSVRWWLDHFNTRGLVNNATKWRETLKAMPMLRPIDIEEVFTPLGVEAIGNSNLWPKYEGSKTPAGITTALNIIRMNGVDMLLESPKVIVGSIHSVKGGEADGVLLFPDQSRAAVEQGDKAAIIRQFYVGMTRARDTLILGSPTAYSAEKGFHVEWE